MQGVLLKIYPIELRRNRGMPVYHGLLVKWKVCLLGAMVDLIFARKMTTASLTFKFMNVLCRLLVAPSHDTPSLFGATVD
jgi:hypothetical protein